MVGGLLEEPVEIACDVALEAAPDLSGGFAFFGASVGVSLGGWVVSEAADCDGVEGPVELAVAVTRESPVGSGLPAVRWDGRDAGEFRERGFGMDPSGV